MPPVERDEFAVRAFPEDRYGLAPAAFEDLDPALRDLVVRAWMDAEAYSLSTYATASRSPGICFPIVDRSSSRSVTKTSTVSAR